MPLRDWLHGNTKTLLLSGKGAPIGRDWVPSCRRFQEGETRPGRPPSKLSEVGSSRARDPGAEGWQIGVMSGQLRYNRMPLSLGLLKRVLVLIPLEGAR
jgi:hypothetical protein